ncbi:pentatricopeptide repeat-containing protein [Citrus sinensis]|uniref:pentatricopeptide repeat-containing protein At1g28690, mitochondrial isoform X1 n=1 Tax=Citrus sinensis TaxID=2711 RepID=UPI0003D7464B|nr:pentatricopeptide repeat-containing protein At1g28690, mitochondrial isoform X1 [Citrus sinensis]KAH9748971.1 pentatricopeptide repeat-containing protein [Citrus sinensis]
MPNLSRIRSSVFSSTHNRHYTLVPPNQTFPPKLQNYDSLSNPLTATSLPSALQHYINSDTPFYGLKIHAHITKTGVKPNTNISIKLLILHLKCGALKYAGQMFDELPQRTLSAYNYMIAGYLKNGQVEESLSLVRKLVSSGERPDGYTFSMILKASTCCRSNVPLPRNLGRMVHAQILKCDVKADDVLYTALVDSYVKGGKTSYARIVFDMMLEKNVICSTSMISGFMSQGFVEDAEEIFRKTVEKDIVVYNAMIEGYSISIETARKALEVYIDLQRLSFRPNISTFASVIGACSVFTDFEFGQQVHCQLIKNVFFEDVKLGSALVDMYAKCGKIDDARRVFDHMQQKNVFTWTSMIDGYGKNGNPNQALELFCMMQECCVQPNYVTFLGALSACGHAGLVDKGREIFESMERDYSMKPKMEHYACMVDLLGRAGSLEQALKFVLEMPEKPNSDVWAALLSSCRLHDDVEMANIAANEIFKLNANDRPGAYVALSNTLAAAGKWDSVTELREKMKLRGVLKDTGCSWVGTESGL